MTITWASQYDIILKSCVGSSQSNKHLYCMIKFCDLNKSLEVLYFFRWGILNKFDSINLFFFGLREEIIAYEWFLNFHFYKYSRFDIITSHHLNYILQLTHNGSGVGVLQGQGSLNILTFLSPYNEPQTLLETKHWWYRVLG